MARGPSIPDLVTAGYLAILGDGLPTTMVRGSTFRPPDGPGSRVVPGRDRTLFRSCRTPQYTLMGRNLLLHPDCVCRPSTTARSPLRLGSRSIVCRFRTIPPVWEYLAEVS